MSFDQVAEFAKGAEDGKRIAAIQVEEVKM